MGKHPLSQIIDFSRISASFKLNASLLIDDVTGLSLTSTGNQQSGNQHLHFLISNFIV